jgi:ATP-binding cassette subfamily F protein 3
MKNSTAAFSTSVIEQVLRENSAILDEPEESVGMDYLVELLRDPDSYDDENALIETLQSFLEETQHDDDETTMLAAATRIVQTLKQKIGVPAASAPAVNTTAVFGSSSSSPERQPPPTTTTNNNNNNNDNNKDEERDDHHQQQQLQSNTIEQRPTTATNSNKNTAKSSGGGSSSKMVQRKERRKADRTKKQAQIKTNNTTERHKTAVTTYTTSAEDDASAWQECQERGALWGGRGKGGRGYYAGLTNSINSNIHLHKVSIALENGTELLTDTNMDITKGHRYGLIGRNGVGKSTLLRRLAHRTIPGMPHDMRVLLVEQQQDLHDTKIKKQPAILDDEKEDEEDSQPVTAFMALIDSDVYRTQLLQEQSQQESRLEDAAHLEPDEIVEASHRLEEILSELDAINADTAEERALEILQGLQFTDAMIHGPVANLSGGWRMRLALARALFIPNVDLICLDECTNHLDLFGLDWLIQFLTHSDKTLFVVSHDRVFLDAICTDIVVLEHQRLTYHVGNYSEYQRQQEEKASREAQILDAAERQRNKAMAFVQKQQSAANKKSADPNKQRQAKMIKEKKMDRIGNYREDGKRYKMFSLKTLDEKSIRLAQKVQTEIDDPVINMHFPNPIWPPGIAKSDTIVRMEDMSFGYSKESTILRDLTLRIDRGSKIALVGPNGCGKSTLVKIIAEEIQGGVRQGILWKHPSLSIGHISQYSVEELEAYSDQTVVEYAEEKLRHGRASAEIVARASGNVRNYLGAFGLGGKHALRRIGNLSGGERMRLCFATVLADNPMVSSSLAHALVVDKFWVYLAMNLLFPLSYVRSFS